MLDYNAKSTYQDASGYSWDYYRDDQKGPNPDPNTFYIIPRPQFVMNDGKPSIQIHTYATDGKDNGSGFCRMDVEISVPSDIEGAISKAILANPTRFPHVTKPNFQSLALNPGSKAVVEFADEQKTLQFVTNASDYGSDVASFLMKLTASQLKSLKAALSTSGGALNLTYYLNVPARLQSVSAILTFNSAIAYSYQVTQPTYNGWGDQTSPGSAQGFLKDSQSSNVKLTWGIAHPPQSLVKTVTDWANRTLASLVSAEVAKVIAVQKMTSSESFKISEVQSFTSHFAEDMVVDWKIEPKAALPSFPDMKLNIKDFESTINKLQQQMIVRTNVPFAAKKGKPDQVTGSGGISDLAKVKSISVKINYPTLPQKGSTFTFSENGTFSVIAQYDEAAGSEWSMDYTVNYEDTNTPSIKGSITNIKTSEQALKLEQVGILAVQFDASGAFNPSEYKAPDKVVVDFSYVNSIEASPDAVNQQLVFEASDTSFVKTVKSLQKLPVSQGYNYQVTYYYDGVQYKAPLQSKQTGFSQQIGAVNIFSTTNLIVFERPSKVQNDPILEVDVKMYFENPNKIPANITNAPTKSSPATFTIMPPTSGSQNIVAHKSFVGLEIANSPLVYTAAVTSASGQESIPPQKIMQNFPSLFLNATQRYFTLEVNLGSIDWKKASYYAIQVIPTFYIDKAKNSTPDTGIQWNNPELESKYHTIGYKKGQKVTYDLEVVYLTKNQNPKKTSYTGLDDVVFDVPATIK